MAITGISLSEKTDHILSFDTAKTEAEGATVFVLGALDSYTRAELSDSVVRLIQTAQGTELLANRNRTALRAIKVGLVGWRNFKDEKGNDIKFETVTEIRNGKPYQVITDACLEVLPAHVQLEIGERIMDLNSIGPDKAGK